MVNISDGTRRSHTLSGLNEDSQYTITVTANNDEGQTMATTTEITTISRKRSLTTIDPQFFIVI